LTYPHIGNVGVNTEDEEANQIFCSGLIIRDLPKRASNFRMDKTLSEYLVEKEIVAIADIDTRRLTRLLREKGAMSGCILTGDISTEVTANEEAALEKAKSFPGMQGMDLAKEVTTPKAYDWTTSKWSLEER